MLPEYPGMELENGEKASSFSKSYIYLYAVYSNDDFECRIHFFILTENSCTSSRLHSSFHCLIGSHVVGFTCGLSILIPPVNKNIQCDGESCPRCLSKLTVSNRENNNLSFSNKDLQMFAYREYVKYFIRSFNRCSTVSAGSV